MINPVPTFHPFALLLIAGQWQKRPPLREKISTSWFWKHSWGPCPTPSHTHSPPRLPHFPFEISNYWYDIDDIDIDIGGKGEALFFFPIYMLLVSKLLKRETLFLSCDQSQCMPSQEPHSFFFYSLNLVKGSYIQNYPLEEQSKNEGWVLMGLKETDYTGALWVHTCPRSSCHWLCESV